MKNILQYTALFLMLVLVSCKGDANQKTTEPVVDKKPKPYMNVIHYYSVKMVDGKAQRDTLSNCFHCNQAVLHDLEGRELENIFYKADMKNQYGREVYKYNAAGAKIGSYYFENQNLVTEYRYELDASNRIVTSSAYEAGTGKFLYGDKRIYDDKGNHIADGNINAEGSIYQYYRRTFNENGIATSEVIEDLEGNPTLSIRYEYRPQVDSNWVEQLTYYDDNLSEIRYRERIEL